MFQPKLNPIEPPWYGPVCPVVWEGRRREASPYPDLRRDHADSWACQETGFQDAVNDLGTTVMRSRADRRLTKFLGQNQTGSSRPQKLMVFAAAAHAQSVRQSALHHQLRR